MTRNIIRLFDRPQDAIDAVRELERIGVEPDEIGFIAGNQENWAPPQLTGGPAANTDEARAGVDAGMTVGDLLGGGLGAIVDAGALAIPGAGAAVAAGWVFSLATGALGGAAVGGLIGALKAEGLADEDAQVCLEAVRRGGAVLGVRCEGTESAGIRDVLERHRGVDPELRGQVYREAGWIGFDPAAKPYERAEIEEERRRGASAASAEPRSFASEPSSSELQAAPDPRAPFAPTWQPGRDV